MSRVKETYRWFRRNEMRKIKRLSKWRRLPLENVWLTDKQQSLVRIVPVGLGDLVNESRLSNQISPKEPDPQV